jgi:hypothetical protein
MRFIGSAIESDLTGGRNPNGGVAAPAALCACAQAPLPQSLGSGSNGAGACFEGDLLHRMDGNRRADFGSRPFLMHLNQGDGASMQCHRKDERCDDCPFARRFVYRCGPAPRAAVESGLLLEVAISGSPERLALPLRFSLLQFAYEYFDERVERPASVTLCTIVRSNKTVTRSKA